MRHFRVERPNSKSEDLDADRWLLDSNGALSFTAGDMTYRMVKSFASGQWTTFVEVDDSPKQEDTFSRATSEASRI